MYKPRSIYVKVALETIIAKLGLGEHNEKKEEEYQEIKELMEKKTCFVTLHKGNSLRGCIGTMVPYRENLLEEIRENAILAAFNDPRFEPLKKEELEELEISVDVLSTMKDVMDENELDSKKYGILVSDERSQGVLLPDLEGVDSVDQQIDIAMSKAGIRDRKGLKIKKFTVKRYR
ncbi:MAG: AmmeMemoRadiSam system protein A [Fusobacteriia bacterium 4572_74]|nr:MAG: AmmeMemoRadiSam system protein A [Fusobacteriia bacterium 4572_74]